MEIKWDVPLRSRGSGIGPPAEVSGGRAEHPDESYRGFFEHSLEGFFQTTPEGRYLRANPALARMYGYESARALMEALTDLNVQLYVDRSRRAEFERLMKNPGEVVGFESQVYRRDGTIIWIVENSRVVRDAQGRPILYEGTVQDITSRKHTEMSLHASQRFIEHVAQSSPNILYVYDMIAARFVYANERIFKILGYTPGELIAMGPMFHEQYTHPDDHWLLAERSTELAAAEDGEVFEYEFRMLDSDRRWRWISARETVFNRSHDGRPHEVIGTAQDITERKDTLSALQQSEERFRRLVEGMDALFWERDVSTGRFNYVSPQAEKLLGYPVEDWYLPKFWLAKVQQDDRERVAGFWQQTDRNGDHSHTTQYRMQRGDGKEVWVRDFGHVTVNETGSQVLQGFMVDVTERQRARAELRKSHEQLRALSTRLQSAREEERIHIAREIHDELGGALTALKMDVSRVGAAVRNGQKHPDAVKEIEERIFGMMTLLDGTMESVRRIATELRPPVLDAFGIVAAIEWQAAEFEKRFSIATKLQNRWSAEIKADQALATALFRIFQEMLTNVARHSNAKACVILLDQDSRNLILSVTDNGRGITVAERNASLGLLGMRERAQLFGGQVEISGTPKAGTEAVLRIPLKNIIEMAAEPKKERLWR